MSAGGRGKRPAERRSARSFAFPAASSDCIRAANRSVGEHVQLGCHPEDDRLPEMLGREGVGVAVDQPGQQCLSFAADESGAVGRPRQRPDSDDEAIPDDDGRWRHDLGPVENAHTPKYDSISSLRGLGTGRMPAQSQDKGEYPGNAIQGGNPVHLGSVLSRFESDRSIPQ